MEHLKRCRCSFTAQVGEWYISYVRFQVEDEKKFGVFPCQQANMLYLERDTNNISEHNEIHLK